VVVVSDINYIFVAEKLIDMLKRYWKSAIVTLMILVLSFADAPAVPKEITFVGWDKVVHVIMYFVLSTVLMTEYFRDKRVFFSRSFFFMICIVYPILIGTITEILQGLIFTVRDPDFYDWTANTFGVFLAWGVYAVYLNLKKK